MRAPLLLGLAFVVLPSAASASDFRDATSDLRLTIDERGPACFLAPESQYDAAACATITTARPAALRSAVPAGSSIHLLLAEAVKADGFLYMAQVAREDRPGNAELDRAGAEAVAKSVMDGMANTAGADVHMRREGPVELRTIANVQVVHWEVGATGPEGSVVIKGMGHVSHYVVVARDATYSITFSGPPDRAADVRQIAQASIATLHAAPAQAHRSGAFDAGYLVGRIAGLGVVGAILVFAVGMGLRSSMKKRPPGPPPPR
jgi:hypothetical protein